MVRKGAGEYGERAARLITRTGVLPRARPAPPVRAGVDRGMIASEVACAPEADIRRELSVGSADAVVFTLRVRYRAPQRGGACWKAYFPRVG
jgi:hypothetical protein